MISITTNSLLGHGLTISTQGMGLMFTYVTDITNKERSPIELDIDESMHFMEKQEFQLDMNYDLRVN